ncbi:MAG TPA: hypothetical protein VH092_07815 [Urbifossiella sp.]|jgi:hypothetical protein|nr:hypothetical protein [Urbifossiella sp.]
MFHAPLGLLIAVVVTATNVDDARAAQDITRRVRFQSRWDWRPTGSG